MITVTYKEHSGEEHQVQGESGQTLMQVATDNMIPGIDADCGGGCACGTCHVIVDEAWTAKVGSPDDMEESMLGMTPERSDGSRLACQIELSDEMDGIVVTMPEFQM